MSVCLSVRYQMVSNGSEKGIKRAADTLQEGVIKVRGKERESGNERV